MIDICLPQAFSHRMLETMADIRDKKELFDFTIDVGGVQFQVHKFFIAACSEYFRAMLKHDTLESKNSQVHLQGIGPTAMKDIIDFCYSRNINLTNENVQETLIAASILQIKELVTLCTYFIKDRVDTSNCLGVLMVAERCNLKELFDETLVYCLDMFESVAKESDEFLTLDDHWLTRIISDNQLNVDNEGTVFDAIIRWVDYDYENRSPKLEKLLSHVRFALMGPESLVSLSVHKYIKNSLGCFRLLSEGKDYHLLERYPDKRTSMVDQRYQPRLPERKQQRIYAVGGWTNDLRPIAQVEKYDPYNDRWSEVSPMSMRRCGVGVAILGDHLYAIGGHDGHTYLKNAERYDILRDIWHKDVPDMSSERTSVGVVALNGYLYAIGGQLAADALDIVERYDPKTNTWKKCMPLGEKRLGAGVTILNGLIYVVGGANPTAALKTVECYDPKTKKWTKVASMNTNRKHLGCTAYNGKIYAIGGRGGAAEVNELDSAECYDPVTNQWEMLPKMSRKRSGIGLVTLDNLIFAVGGQSGDERLKLVEAYDPMNRRWLVKEPLMHERLGGGIAVHSPMVHNTRSAKF